jgi:ribose 5-phosphate isomerase B
MKTDPSLFVPTMQDRPAEHFFESRMHLRTGISLDTKTAEMLISHSPERRPARLYFLLPRRRNQRERHFHVKLAIGSDHGGFELKQEVLKYLKSLANIQITDVGPANKDSVDYPDFGARVAEAVSSGAADRGILICGTGIGMSIVANRYPMVRAALCHDHFTAQMSREHNDANILVMGERVIGKGVALDIVETWLVTEFAAGRHQLRLDKIRNLKP